MDKTSESNELDVVLYLVYLIRGAIIPATPEEVAFVERYRKPIVYEIPEGLRDPMQVLKRRKLRAEEGKTICIKPT